MQRNLVVWASFATPSDGPIWFTEGRQLAFSELRYALLVVGQTMAQSMPRQQTPIGGQMIQYQHDVV